MKQNIKFNIKMYAKIFLFALVFWIIAAVWYYFVPYKKDAIVRFRLMKSFKFSLYQMRWVFAGLLSGIIFLFWWIEGEIKALVKEVEELRAKTTIESKTNETRQKKQIKRDFDRKKAMSRFID